MPFSTSIVLLVAGAILRFAVDVNTSGFDIRVVGLILMIAGGVSLALSILWMAFWSDDRRRRDYERRGPPPGGPPPPASD